MRNLIIIFLLFISTCASAQTFQERLDSLSGLLYTLRNTTNPTETAIADQDFERALESTLVFPEAFKADFSDMKTLGCVLSLDEEFRIFSWNVEQPDGSQVYHAFVVKPGKQKNKVIKLEDKVQLLTKGSEVESFDNKRWYGALYYQIIPVKGKRGTFYTLMGWDGTSSLSTRRVIETMQLSGNKVRFGIPVIRTSNGVIRRMVFEYADEISMVMRFEDKGKKNQHIVFDHLSPKAPQLEGFYEQYVPDGSYDALHLVDGEWVLITDYNATNKKQLIEKRFNDPNDPNNPNNPNKVPPR
jgi:hypothetical protein